MIFIAGNSTSTSRKNQKKGFISISFKMERQRAEEMAEIMKETNLSKTAIMEKAIEMY